MYFVLYVHLQISIINIDIHGFFSLAQWEGGAKLLRTLFLRKKYNKNIDDIYFKGENQEPKKWSLFGIVRIYIHF